MKVFKIKHKPSGLFFKPSNWPNKINLSKNGKIYHKKPSFNYLGRYYHHPDDWKKTEYGYKSLQKKPRLVNLEEWEIVEFNLE